MKIKIADLWSSKDDIILVTGNSYIRLDNELVMGRGAALELKNRYPILAKNFGLIIKDTCGSLGKYGVMTCPVYRMDNTKTEYGIFQVKYHFKDDASPDLVSYSTSKLLKLLDNEFCGKTISMNFPAIGFGRLDENLIIPIISILPDSVTIYKL